MSLLFPVHPLFGRGGGLLQAPNVADVFSTDLYTGNGSTQTITNGVDLAGKGGLVWLKARGISYNHILLDTLRGGGAVLFSDTTNQEISGLTNYITTFNSSGYSIGDNFNINRNTYTYVAWTFRRAPRFFDVVTYTGDGVAGRTISHNLGQVPGMVVVKRRDSTGDWAVYHRGINVDGDSAPETDVIYFTTDAAFDTNVRWDDTAPTDSSFTLGTAGQVNASGGTYVAYLFAHDTASDGVIQCGSYTGNGSTTGPVITLGWEPQWVMIKGSGGTGSWVIHDNQRDTSNPRNATLLANDSGAEGSGNDVDFLSTGFQLKTTSVTSNRSGSEHIYVAIRAEGA
jgi:hypothetical protein